MKEKIQSNRANSSNKLHLELQLCVLMHNTISTHEKNDWQQSLWGEDLLNQEKCCEREVAWRLS